MRKTLVVMVKEPRPGQVKTRLARDIGPIAAVWWYRHQTARLLHSVTSPKWETVLAVSPDTEGLSSKVWPARLPRFAQGRGDLGRRMAKILNQSPDPVCIIGSDIPGVTASHIDRAFAALGSADLVLGPAYDGGYWLIGAKRPTKQLFAGVRWSTKHAFADTVASWPGARVATVDRLRDVDTARDLAMTLGQRRDSPTS